MYCPLEGFHQRKQPRRIDAVELRFRPEVEPLAGSMGDRAGYGLPELVAPRQEYQAIETAQERYRAVDVSPERRQ
jgi:hypothetical protein